MIVVIQAQKLTFLILRHRLQKTQAHFSLKDSYCVVTQLLIAFPGCQDSGTQNRALMLPIWFCWCPLSNGTLLNLSSEDLLRSRCWRASCKPASLDLFTLSLPQNALLLNFHLYRGIFFRSLGFQRGCF